MNLRKLKKNITAKIDKGTVEVRGEVYIAKKDFTALNRKRSKQGEEPFANPRNLAAGSMRQLDAKLVASRHLSFLSYSIASDLGQTTHKQEHDVLVALGFATDATATECLTTDTVIDYWKGVHKKREGLPYQIDGVVVAVNNNKLFDKLGVAGKSPRGVRALKFSPRQATTTIEDIRVHVGRTGAVTPIAYLAPVEIGGVTVSRATLHNEDEIERLGVKIGDTVIVERAGDVIPDIVSVVGELRTGKEKSFRMPRTCPECSTPIVRKRGEAIARCLNPECESRKRESLYYFVSRAAFDIDGLGPKIIDRLLDNDLISDPIDLFTLKAGDLEQLEGFQEKSAHNIIKAIEASKRVPFYRFLKALNIRYVGEETAIDLAQHFGSIEALQEASLSELETMEGIGEVTAEYIHTWLHQKKNRKFIQKLLNAGIRVEAPKRTGTKLAGKTFVFTGSLEALGRQDAERRVRTLGGDPASSVSVKTDYVVAGESPGSKADKAKKLGVRIISEKQFLNMIK